MISPFHQSTSKRTSFPYTDSDRSMTKYDPMTSTLMYESSGLSSVRYTPVWISGLFASG